jgi:hypothetical protein
MIGEPGAMKTSRVILAASLWAMGLLDSGCARASDPRYVYLPNANTRETYQTVHRVNEAHQLATGKGVRVGVIDKFFGFKKHPELYSGGKDFAGDQGSFDEVDEHGCWMATTLKELAPGAQVYALGVRSNNKRKEAEAFARAVVWAIENRLDVLTYSAEAFAPEHRPVIDQAIATAVGKGLTTVFINVDHPLNILPYTFFSPKGEHYGREPDLRVFHLDYTLLNLESYGRFLRAHRQPRSGDEMPYFSLSSTAVVVAAGVAMLKEVNPRLTPADCKAILVQTSKPYTYAGRQIERSDESGEMEPSFRCRANDRPSANRFEH